MRFFNIVVIGVLLLLVSGCATNAMTGIAELVENKLVASEYALSEK